MINIDVGDLFKSLGSFLAKNWQGVGLVIMLVLFFVTKNDYAALKKSKDVMSQSYEEQLSLIKELHQEEINRRDDVIASYEQLVEKLKEEHLQDLEDLAEEKEKEVEESIKDFEEQPEKLAQEIEDLFGFKYVE